MKNILRTIRLEHKKAQPARDRCYKMFIRISRSPGTLKEQVPILAAYTPELGQSYISESCYENVTRQRWQPSSSHSNCNQVTLHLQSDSIRSKSKGKPIRYVMDFTVVPNMASCGVILGRGHKTWAKSDDCPGTLYDVPQSVKLRHMSSWGKGAVWELFAKANHAKKQKCTNRKSPKVELEEWPDIQHKLSQEIFLFQSPLNPGHRSIPQSSNMPLENTEMSENLAARTMNNDSLPTSSTRHSCHIIHIDPENVEIPHTHILQNEEPTNITDVDLARRDSAFTETFFHPLPVRGNNTPVSGKSSNQRAERRRATHRTPQEADISPISEVPSHSLSPPSPSLPNPELSSPDPLQPNLPELSPYTQPDSSKNPVLNASPHQACETENPEITPPDTTQPPFALERYLCTEEVAMPNPAVENVQLAPLTRNHWGMGGIEIAKPAASSPEELAALRASETYWTWDEAVKRYHRVNSETGSAIWYGDED